jgi:hypothetical protein
MKSKFTRVCGSFILMLTATACGTSNPLQPTTGTTGGSTSARVSVTVPQSVAGPADGALIPYFSLPLTLAIGNAVSTASAAPTYTFEVATDSGFTAVVYTKKGVAQGANGQTSVTVDTKLAPSTAYFWRARAVSGDTVGPAPQAKTFTVGPDIILLKPVLASPAQNGSATGAATLVVNKVERSGPVGQITYQFDVSSSQSFDRIVFTQKVPEQNGTQTSIAVPTTALTPGTTYSWRVQASDSASGVTSDFSDTFSFRYTAFDPKKAIFVDNPADVGSWPETATITSIDFTSDAILVDFTKRTGPGRWIEAGFGDGGIQYTLGMCFNINGQWYCSAAIQFWQDRELEASGLPSEIARNWYYDTRWGAMMGHQPAQGELVAIFVGHGNLRGSGNTYVERSNFVLLPFGGSYHP